VEGALGRSAGEEDRDRDDGSDAGGAKEPVRGALGRDRREPEGEGVPVAVLQPGAHACEPALDPRAHRRALEREALRDRLRREPVVVAEEERLLVDLRQRDDDLGDPAAERALGAHLVRGRDRVLARRGAFAAGAALAVAPRAADEVLHDAGEPAPAHVLRTLRAPERDEPRLLHDVVRRHVVAEEASRHRAQERIVLEEALDLRVRHPHLARVLPSVPFAKYMPARAAKGRTERRRNRVKIRCDAVAHHGHR
jgi:hypothetical protein